jgi:hypothetical protein
MAGGDVAVGREARLLGRKGKDRSSGQGRHSPGEAPDREKDRPRKRPEPL